MIVQAASRSLRDASRDRDREATLLERGKEVDHAAVNRWGLASPLSAACAGSASLVVA
ncbi:hypothetical protein SAMN05192568_103144 [Methylobacterium pseudosasicola]|uniref:Uncharacterized protein n=1 Tax=Methylobacterium pseudosasicola TaxID=582667 RepID=A0A1I4QUB3_9HYPH|nr:hypothetical protein SAMN05192568_103144 [Methylobacterium pseudosasicola]